MKKHKKKYGLLRKIHYQKRIKYKNTKQLLPIKKKLSDLRSEVIRWFNKWTERPSRKFLLIYGDPQVILNFI